MTGFEAGLVTAIREELSRQSKEESDNCVADQRTTMRLNADVNLKQLVKVICDFCENIQECKVRELYTLLPFSRFPLSFQRGLGFRFRSICEHLIHNLFHSVQ